METVNSTKMLIYIGGYSRSGSTISDIILGNHPSIFSAGELYSLPEEWNLEYRQCACGEKYPKCSFWEDLNLSKASATQWYETLNAVESRSALPTLLNDGFPSELIDRYRQINTTILEYIRDKSGKSVILDSSKNARFAAGRALALKRYCAEDVFFVHALRHPFSVINSFRKKGSNWAAEGHGKEKKLLTLRSMAGWKKANTIAAQTGEILGSERYCVLKHENVLSSPEIEYQHLGDFLGLDFSQIVENIASNSSFSVGHNVGGNRLRNSNDIKLQKTSNNGSVEQIPGIYQLPFKFYCGSLCKQFGYELAS